MLAAKIRWNGDLKPLHASSKMMPVGGAASENGAPAAGPTRVNTYGWSGVAATNNLKKWNAAVSFYDAYSEFSVPTTQAPFGTCGFYYESSWVGLDGYTSALSAEATDPLQGGEYATVQCGSATVYQTFIGFGVDTYGEFPTFPGDIMYVEVSDGLGGNNPGYVFIEDLTTLTYNAYNLIDIGPVAFIGNSAEWVVERPGYVNNLGGGVICR